MRTRIIHTKIWNDEWFFNLSTEAKLLFIYLITNEHIGLTGYIELSDRIICNETNIPIKKLQEIKKELEGKVRFYGGWVYVTNFSKYDPIKGDNNPLRKAYEKELASIPQEIRGGMDAPTMGHQGPIDGSQGKGKGIGMVEGKGGVGGKRAAPTITEPLSSKNSHTPCTDEEIQEVSAALQVAKKDVELVHSQICDKIAAGDFSRSKYKTVYYTLRNWVRNGIQTGRIKTLPATRFVATGGPKAPEHMLEIINKLKQREKNV